MITQKNLNSGLMGYTREEIEDFEERGKIPKGCFWNKYEDLKNA